MAKINLYQQDRLASSLVGTPGLYTAGAQSLGNIAQGAENIGNSIQAIGNAIFGDQLAERRRREAEARAADKQIKDADRASYISDRLGAADVEFTQAYTDIQSKYANDTTGAVQAYQAQAKQIRDQYVSKETDPLTKAELQKAMASKQAQYIGDVASFVQGRQIPIMKDRLQNMAGNFSLMVSNPNLSAADFGKKYQEYVQQNLPNYQFTEGAAAPIEMRKALEPAVINYLESTALNHPELLDDRIKAFSGGSMIDPSKLNSIVNQQKAMANAVASKQLADLHLSQAASQAQATAEIIDATPTGDSKDADPAKLVAIQKKYAGSLSPEQNNNISRIIKESTTEKTKEAAKTKTLNSEQRVVGGFATYAAREEQLAGRILQSVDTMLKTKDKNEMRTLIQKNQLLIDQYQDTYLSLNALKNSIKDPATRKMAELHVIASKDRFGKIVGKLQNSPDGMRASQIKDDLYGKVYPANIFPDAKTQGVYNYFYKNTFYETLQNMNISPDKMQQLASNPKAVQALRNVLAKKAYQGMVNFKIVDF